MITHLELIFCCRRWETHPVIQIKQKQHSSSAELHIIYTLHSQTESLFIHSCPDGQSHARARAHSVTCEEFGDVFVLSAGGADEKQPGREELMMGGQQLGDVPWPLTSVPYRRILIHWIHQHKQSLRRSLTAQQRQQHTPETHIHTHRDTLLFKSKCAKVNVIYTFICMCVLCESNSVNCDINKTLHHLVHDSFISPNWFTLDSHLKTDSHDSHL